MWNNYHTFQNNPLHVIHWLIERRSEKWKTTRHQIERLIGSHFDMSRGGQSSTYRARGCLWTHTSVCTKPVWTGSCVCCTLHHLLTVSKQLQSRCLWNSLWRTVKLRMTCVMDDMQHQILVDQKAHEQASHSSVLRVNTVHSVFPHLLISRSAYAAIFGSQIDNVHFGLHLRSCGLSTYALVSVHWGKHVASHTATASDTSVTSLLRHRHISNRTENGGFWDRPVITAVCPFVQGPICRLRNWGGLDGLTSSFDMYY